jgi:hypothetical protein
LTFDATVIDFVLCSSVDWSLTADDCLAGHRRAVPMPVCLRATESSLAVEARGSRVIRSRDVVRYE